MTLAVLLSLACGEPEDVPGFDDFAEERWSPADTPTAELAGVDSALLVPPGLPAGSVEVVDGEDDGAGEGADDGEVGGSDNAAANPPAAFPPPDTTEGRDADVDLEELYQRGEYTGPFQRPEHIRGLYLNAWATGSSRRRADLIALADSTEINTFVLDIKDASGFISHPTGVPLADSVGATGEVRIRNLQAALADLEEAGIYPIARIVVVKDPILTAGRPDLAVQDTAGGIWVDSNNLVWLNAFDQEVWDYHIQLALEVAAMGFPEIQLDYVRFPDAPLADLERAVYRGRDGRLKRDAIRDGLGYTRERLADVGVYLSADVFGVTTSASRDVGIGQVWESFIDQVDAALPMVYPSHYWVGSFGIDEPNGHPYEIVRRALGDALKRSAKVPGAGRTIPWLQDFTLGAPRYEAPEVRAQIQAAYDAGIQEWILWNPSNRYTEDALEPARGWAPGYEPLMRVGGEIVPVSERFEALARARKRASGEAADSSNSGSGPARPDSVPMADSVVVPDTLAFPDTLGVGRR